MKIDPIIAVKDVAKSSIWYQQLFGCKSMHGGDEFEVLLSNTNEVFICLHKWEEHGHPSMMDPNITPGNGLILYFRMENMEDIHLQLVNIGYPIEREIQMNTNSGMKEFSVVDPNGYYLTISEFHKYGNE